MESPVANKMRLFETPPPPYGMEPLSAGDIGVGEAETGDSDQVGLATASPSPDKTDGIASNDECDIGLGSKMRALKGSAPSVEHSGSGYGSSTPPTNDVADRLDPNLGEQHEQRTNTRTRPPRNGDRRQKVGPPGPTPRRSSPRSGVARANASRRSSQHSGRPSLENSCAALRKNLIGRLSPVETPFGSKPLVYADWTASGRPVKSIENFMNKEVLPRYGNTHTTSSETGSTTTAFREEARQIIARCLNAKCGAGHEAHSGSGDDGDVVIFTGSGTTAAVAKIVSTLGLDQKKSRSWWPDKRPVVFIGPFEHHSNILPWRESCADVVQIAESAAGGLDLDDLERNLKKYSRRRLKIGSFAAASNLTGAIEDTVKVTRILHGGGALSFWDYATAAPYVEVDMNPKGYNDADEALAAKDAVFISGHKFLGGAGTPGLLVCKKKLFQMTDKPVVKGGGTVLFVSEKGHTYLSNIEEREEGGTPDILGSIRLGLVFQMKHKLGNIESREERLAQMGLTTLRSNPRIALLGDTGRRRLPIFSFLIRHGNRFLHHNFVCALLNDLFGIQARAGCQCAGPYGIRLLEIGNKDVPKIKKQIENDIQILKPGFCRLSLAFFVSDAEARYILDAVKFVADHGASFLPLYEPNPHTSEWKFNASSVQPSGARKTRPKLNEARFGFSNRRLVAKPDHDNVGAEQSMSASEGAESEMFAALMNDALHMSKETKSMFSAAVDRTRRISMNREAEALRWFYFAYEDASVRDYAPLIITPKLYGRGRPAGQGQNCDEARLGQRRLEPTLPIPRGGSVSDKQVADLVARLQELETKLAQQEQQEQQEQQQQLKQQQQRQSKQQQQQQQQQRKRPVKEVAAGGGSGGLTDGGLGDSCYF